MKKLKNILLLLAVILSTSETFSQSQSDSVYIIRETDDMSGKVYVYGNRAFIVSNPENTTGFRISTYITDQFEVGMITVKMVGLGGCNENDEMIILLENGEKITKRSWKKFNCEGEAYFSLDNYDLDLLRKTPISKIRITNGRTYKSYTGEVKTKDKRYFIQLLYSIDNKISTNKNGDGSR